MKAETISDAMNYIDSDLIFMAEESRGRKKAKTKALKLGIAAACFIFIAASALVISSVINRSLPPLELAVSSGGGMGFEGYFLKNADEFECDNPWNNGILLTRLPVYSNIAFDEKGTPCALSENQLDERIRKAADKADMTVTSITKSFANDLYGGYEKDFVYAVNAETAEGMITANAAGGITVSFNVPVALPFDCDPSDRTEAEKAAEFFGSSFSALISEFMDFEKPAYCVSYRYDVYGNIKGTYTAYDSSGSNNKDILNYNLQFAEFRLDESGNLTSIYISNAFAGTQKIGDYPIISASKAKKELAEGNFITSVPYDFPGNEYIAKTDLVYKGGRGESIAPYYRFIIELPEAPENNGMKSYGIYYVPAVNGKYISKINLIDGEIQ